MFEQQQPGGGLPEQGSIPPKPAQPMSGNQMPQQEPEDIFSGINTGGVSQPNNMPSSDFPEFDEPSGGKGKKILLIILVVVIVILVIAGGVLAYLSFTAVPQQEVPNFNDIANVNLEINSNIPIPVNENSNLNLEENINLNQPAGLNAIPALDSDNDGLSDAEEAILGTNAFSADTDNDGLTDKEEVQIYNTDPLKPDTDGDGYLDGVEVSNGYNPNGPGTLLTPPNPENPTTPVNTNTQ